MAGNYEEDRLAQIEEEKNTALQEVKDTYEGMAQEAGAVFDKQIAGVEAYKDQQLQLQHGVSAEGVCLQMEGGIHPAAHGDSALLIGDRKENGVKAGNAFAETQL